MTIRPIALTPLVPGAEPVIADVFLVDGHGLAVALDGVPCHADVRWHVLQHRDAAIVVRQAMN